MGTLQTGPAPFVPCDKLADTIDLVERWWSRLPQGATLVQENLDVLALLLRGLRDEAYHVATGVRMFAMATALLAEPPDIEPRQASALLGKLSEMLDWRALDATKNDHSDTAAAYRREATQCRSAASLLMREFPPRVNP